MKEEKIIEYDNPEAAIKVNMDLWKSAKGHYYITEESARKDGATHKRCACGGLVENGWTTCQSCRYKAASERYKAYPYKEYVEGMPVTLRDGDKYFFSSEEIEEFIYEQNEDCDEDDKIDSVDLIVCEPVHYRTISSEDFADDAHDDWEPEKELEDAVEVFNKVIRTLSPHSWKPGKFRTSYVSTENNE